MLHKGGFSLIQNKVGSRYFIGQYNLDEFPFAIGKCQPHLIVNPVYSIYDCVSTTDVKQSFYSDDACTLGYGDENDVYYNLSTIAGSTGEQYSGELYDFNCNYLDDSGSTSSSRNEGNANDTIYTNVNNTDMFESNDGNGTNTYAKVRMTAGDCGSAATNFVTVYAALNVCTQQETNLDTTFSVHCQTTPNIVTQLQYYQFGSSCGEDNFLYQRNATGDCDWLLTSDTAGFTVTVYGQVKHVYIYK